MAFRFVEADEEFMGKKKQQQKKVRTTGLKFSNNGQRRKEKMSNLKATKYVPEINEALDNFCLDVINK